MKTKNCFINLCLIIVLGPMIVWSAPLTVRSCKDVMWRGLDTKTDLSHLDNNGRLKRQTDRDQDEVYSFFENLAEYYSGRRSLAEAAGYPNTLYAPQFFVNHFSQVYSDRSQFQLFLNTLYRIGSVLKIPLDDIAPGALVPHTAPIRDSWEDLFLRLGSVSQHPENLTLLTVTLFIELELSHQQGHPFVFLGESAHKAFANMLEKVMENQVYTAETRKTVKSSIEDLFNDMQSWVKQKQELQSKNKISSSTFEGQSPFSKSLQKLVLKDLRTGLVEYDIVLAPLSKYLVETLEGHPELANELVRRAQTTILRERPELSEHPNYVISLDKLPDPSYGAAAFVDGMFNFSKFQGLWSFAALFKNLPEPDKLPRSAQEAIKNLFKRMEKPQVWPLAL